LEQSLYNGVLATISLDGTNYFYVNPLKRLKSVEWPLRTWRTRQPNIKGCFCCPPNIVRTIAEAQEYIYTLSPNAVWVNLYGASSLATRWVDGSAIRLHQKTDYPWQGEIEVVIDEAPARPIALRLRVPGWSGKGEAKFSVNGRAIAIDAVPGTYAEIERQWQAGDRVTVTIPMVPTLWKSNPLVEETLNQAALRCGPMVYCVEAADLPAGVRVEELAFSLDESAKEFARHREHIAGAEVITLSGQALRIPQNRDTSGGLYAPMDLSRPVPIPVKLIPYFAWNNRGDQDMSVWLPVR
jgi:DUF1680 family protein